MESDRLEIIHEPYKKIIYRTHLQFDSPEDLASSIALAVPASVPAQATLRWANGILLSVAPFVQTDSVAKEYIAGNLLWDHIDFALMERYRKVVALPDKPMVTISVLDVSNHPIYGPFCEWVKNNLVAKGKKVIR